MNLVSSFLHLLYPPLCLHCGESLSDEEPLFCLVCLQTLELIEPSHRCPFCFAEHEIAKLSACLKCRRKAPILTRLAAACEETGAAATLLHCLKEQGRPELAKGAGALMATQLLQLKWPLPDLIVPIPITFLRMLERGYNQSHLLAEVVGTILERPVENLLKRRSGDYRQSLLTRAQREALSGDCFSLRREKSVKGKTILLIDDQMTTGTTLSHCAEILVEEGAKAVYGLVFCKGM